MKRLTSWSWALALLSWGFFQTPSAWSSQSEGGRKGNEDRATDRDRDTKTDSESDDVLFERADPDREPRSKSSIRVGVARRFRLIGEHWDEVVLAIERVLASRVNDDDWLAWSENWRSASQAFNEEWLALSRDLRSITKLLDEGDFETRLDALAEVAGDVSSVISEMPEEDEPNEDAERATSEWVLVQGYLQELDDLTDEWDGVIGNDADRLWDEDEDDGEPAEEMDDEDEDDEDEGNEDDEESDEDDESDED